MPTISQLMAALPETVDDDRTQRAEAIDRLALRPVPVGALRRLTLLGTLQAKIAASYLFYWLRGFFRTADDKKRLLAETHWRTALRLLDSMTYLRGAVMKAGQMLANFPDIAPREFVETLERLHYDAPPMHWSLLREMVHQELGDDPENRFAEFDKQAFAAASLGQVHRAALPSGEEVAVKIQYPGIARTIREDFRNLAPFLLPARLSSDWDSTKDQFDDLRSRLEQETDYELEAQNLRRARALFREDDGIVIPRVYDHFCTSRVLTMERLDGLHLDAFIAGNPPQEQRNEIARKMLTAWYRLLFAGRMLYADFHPGNFLCLADGRLGVVDFGLVLHMNDEDWELMRRIDQPLTTGRREDRVAAMRDWCQIREDETERMEWTDRWADWCWRSRYCGGSFDFGDEADLRRGIELFTEMVRRRYSRARPSTPIISRQHLGWRGLLYRLRANIDVRPIAEREVRAAGWDRSAYAGDGVNEP